MRFYLNVSFDSGQEDRTAEGALFGRIDGHIEKETAVNYQQHEMSHRHRVIGFGLGR